MARQEHQERKRKRRPDPRQADSDQPATPLPAVPTFPAVGPGQRRASDTAEAADQPGQLGPTRAEAVAVAWVHGDHVSYSFFHSIIELLGLDMATSGRVLFGGYISIRYGTDGLPAARNMAARNFLRDGAADWLLFVDTDMGFPATAVEQLIQAADPTTAPIVGALCFAQIEEAPDGLGGWLTRPTPTIYDWAKVTAPEPATEFDGDGRPLEASEPVEQMGFVVRYDYARDTRVRCAGTGMACVLIHRSVFERVEAAYGPTWFDRVPNTTTGQLIGEDLSFFLRCGTLDVPVHVHTGVRTTHLKRIWVGEENFAAHRIAYPAMAEPIIPVSPVGEADDAEADQETAEADQEETASR